MNSSLVRAGLAVRFATVLLLLGLSLSFASAQQVQTMDQLNQSVWTRLYHVSQANDPEWLAADDDGDGISNGAEIAAGTDPFSAGSAIVISSITVSNNVVHLGFKTSKGKYYTLQQSTDLTDPASWTAVTPAAGITGTGLGVTLDAPYAVNTYFRVLVQDLDSDGDGVSDWAEIKLGLDPMTGQSNNTVDAYGRPLADNEYASRNLSAENSVAVSASGSDSSSTQPDAGQAASDVGAFTLSRGGLPTVLPSIAVNLTIAGTATAGTDYVPLSTTVIMPAGTRTVTLPVVPLTNVNRTAPVAVTMTVASGNGYTVNAGAATAGVTIIPTGTPAGTGLTGSYYNGSGVPVSSTSNFKPSTLTVDSAHGNVLAPSGALANGSVIYFSGTTLPAPLLANKAYYVRDVGTFAASTFNVAASSGDVAIPLTSAGSNFGYYFQRVDPTVDFKWSTAGSLPSGLNGGNFSVRWTGQIQPQYTETYFFDVAFRQGVLLKIGGKTVATDWQSSTTTLKHAIGSIALQANIRYDIELDYFSQSGASVSETHLNWYSDSQASQVVPTSRLYPSVNGASAAPPTITSSPQAFAYLGQTFNFVITTSSNVTTTVALSAGSLPPGLSYSTAVQSGANVGLISGTATKAGDYPLVVTATNTAGSSSAVLDLQVLDSGNLITKEVWTGLPPSGAPSVAEIPLSTPPNITGTLTSFEDTAANYGDDYGERIRGFITVPTTGMYYFYVAGNDQAELWISTDSEPVNKVKRCSSTGTTARKWSAAAGQKSDWLAMTAGVKYYVEVLHRGVTGTANNVAVGYVYDALAQGTATLADGSGVMPGYLIWQYFNPPVAYSSDASSANNLFFTKMSSQGAAVTTGSGLATIRLSSDQTTATVKFNYSGLTTAVTGKHIHNDQYLTHPSQIIFDMDTATPNADGSYTWQIGAVGSFTNPADIVQLIREGKAYINIHTVNYPAGEIRGNFTIANGAQNFVPPVHPNPSFTLPTPSGATDADLSRFLSQATFGPMPSDFISGNPSSLRSLGFVNWINQQLDSAQTPPSHLLDFVTNSRDVNNPYPDEQTYYGFWRTAVTAPDQLRQRVAYALSQILVTSSIGPLDNNARALSSYYDMLVDYSFGNPTPGISIATLSPYNTQAYNANGNFRNLLKATTLHPAMGRYLDMLGNRNGDLVTGRIPNENFGREILQLFSIGLNKLWPDGSLVLDSKFNPIATYEQPVVQGFARVFTGWSYFQPRNGTTGRLPTNFNGSTDATVWVTAMQHFPANGVAATSSAYHELGAKRLLNNAFIPPTTFTDPSTSSKVTDINSPYYGENNFDANGLRDLDKGLDAIFNHPNVGPFICRQLIQRLVSSQPTPGYVYRVVQAFNGDRTWDGVRTGVRGDLKEVVKAILLDYEARSTAVQANASFGKQREPILRITTPARYFISKPVTGTFTQSSTYNATSNPVPYRMRLDLTGDVLVGNNEWLALSFKSLTNGTSLPVSTYNQGTWYLTRTAATFTQPGAATPRTNPTIWVDPIGLQGATYTQSSAFKPFTVNATTDVVTATAHGLTAGTPVWLTWTTSPGGVSLNTQYLVAAPVTTDSFKLTTVGGVAVNFTGNGAGLNYASPGNIVTVTTVSSALNNNVHTLRAGPTGTLPSVYVRFFGPGAPAEGFFPVTEVTSTTVFKVTASNSALIVSTTAAPAAFNRLGNCSYTLNNTHTAVNMNTPIPHGLSVGQQFWLTDNSSVAATQTVTGLWTVASIPNDPVTGLPDPYRFVFSAPGTGTTTLAESGVTLFPNAPPILDRTGTLDFFASSFQMGRTDSESTSASLSQTPMASPTVFNFYLPDYAYPGDLALNGISTPEFQLTSDTNIMLLTNFIEQGVHTSSLTDGRSAFRAQANTGAVVMDLSPLMTPSSNLASANLGAAIVDKLNRELMGGTMSTGMRTQIINYVGNPANFPYSATPTATELRERMRAIVQLIITSPEFAVQR